MDDIRLICFIVFGTIVYFVPSIIAIKRHHPNAAPIVVVNVCMGGLCGVGWFVALAWSLSAIPTVKVRTRKE